jgi:antitoxin ChpS
MLQSLRRAGGSLIITVPKPFVDENGLIAGSQLEVQFSGKTMTLSARVKPRYRAADLMAEMPDGLPLVEGWDSLPAVGLERD